MGRVTEAFPYLLDIPTSGGTNKMMTLKIAISLVFITICSWAALAIFKDWQIPEDQRVYFRGTKTYARAIEMREIGETEALLLIRESTEDEPIYLHPKPLFFVDNQYCFGNPGKTYLPLTGYYVNSDSGRIVFRQSNEILTRSDSKIAPIAYESATIISEGIGGK